MFFFSRVSFRSELTSASEPASCTCPLGAAMMINSESLGGSFIIFLRDKKNVLSLMLIHGVFVHFLRSPGS